MFVLEVHSFLLSLSGTLLHRCISLCLCSSVHGHLLVSRFWQLLIELSIGFCEVIVFIAGHSLLVYV